MANFKRLSRYTGGIVSKNRNDEDFIVLKIPLKLKEGDNDKFIEVTQDFITRPDLLSSKVYGTPELWWVIYEFNGIQDPITELKVGQILRIPEINRVLDAINGLEL